MADTFTRVGSFKNGYATEQVDEFLNAAKKSYAGEESQDIDEHAVHSASFDWTRKGYDPALVDAALDRLEAAFVQRRRARIMETEGEEAWLEKTYEEARTLYPRLLRPVGERFADATGRGYSKGDVDTLLNSLAKYFDGETALTSADVRDAVFAPAWGTKAYAENVVDVYLDRAVSVLLAVE